MPDYPAIYRASVFDVDDPDNLGRLRLQVPQVLGDAASAWAEPSLAPNAKYRPEVGDRLWVFFEGADINHPVYISKFGVSADIIVPGTLGDLIDEDPSVIPEAADGVSPAKVLNVSTKSAKGLIFLFWSLVNANALGAPQTSRVRYHVHVSQEATFTPGSDTLLATTEGNMVAIRTLADGITDLLYEEPDLLPDGVTPNPLAGTKKSYFFIVVAEDVDSEALPSDTVSGTMDKNGSDDLLLGSVTAEHLAGIMIIGNTITTRSLDPATGLLTGAGYELTGDTLIAYDILGNKRLEIDPSNNTFVFRGDGEIDHLTVQTLTALQKTVLTQGSTFVLQSSVSPPSNPATASFFYDVKQFNNDDNWGDRVGFSTDGTYFYTVRNRNDAGKRALFERWNSDGTLNSSRTILFAGNSTSFTVWGGLWVAAHNMYVAVGYDSLYGSVYFITNCESSSEREWEDVNFASNPVQLFEQPNRAAALGYDAAADDLIIAQATGTVVRIWRANWTSDFGTGGFPGAIARWATPEHQFQTSFPWNYNLSGVAYGTFDFGVNRYIIANRGISTYKVFTTSGVEETIREWPIGVEGGLQGFYWDGATFVAMNKNGLRYTYDSSAGNKWTLATDGSWWLSYNYYGPTFPITATRTNASAVLTGLSATTDLGVGMPISGTGIPGNTTILSIGPGSTLTMSAAATSSGTATVTVGPGRTLVAASIVPVAMVKRAQLRVTVPDLPAGVLGAEIYLSKGSTPPTATTSSMTKQGATAGVTVKPSLVVSNAMFTPNNNPIIQTFGAGVSSKFQSAGGDIEGPYVDIWGDGSFRLGWLRGNALGANPLAALKTSDQTVPSSTTLVDCTQLAFPVVAGNAYRFQAMLRVSGGFTGDIKVGFTYPNGEMSAMFIGPDVADLTTGTVARANFVSRQGSANVLTSSSFGTSTSPTDVLVFGSFVATASGTVQLQFAQDVSNATGTTVQHGSYIVGECMS